MSEILVAHGEPHRIIEYLNIMSSQYNFDVEITRQHLKLCDYIIRKDGDISGDIGIERKSADDFVNSIMDGRLFAQIIDMHIYYKRVIVILEGDVSNIYSKIHDHSKLGAMGSIIAQYGTSLVHTLNKSWTAYFILSILKHSNMNVDMTKIFRPKIDIEDREIGAISCADGIGGTLARKIYEKFRLKDLAIISMLNNPKLISDNSHGIGVQRASKLLNLFTNAKDINEYDVELFKKYLTLIYNNKLGNLNDNNIKRMSVLLKNTYKKLI